MRRRSRVILIVLLAVLTAVVAVGCRYRGYLAGLLPSTAAEAADLTVPPGFRIAVYADNVPNARQMALGPAASSSWARGPRARSTRSWTATATTAPRPFTCWPAA